MSMRRPLAARKTARTPASPKERRSHHNRADSDPDEDRLNSVRPARKTAVTRKNTAHKSAPAKPNTSHPSTSVVPTIRKPGIGKAALKTPTPDYGTGDASLEESDASSSLGDSSSVSSMSMSQPSSHDEDEHFTVLGHLDVKTGSAAPGPSPDPDKLVRSLVKIARELDMPVDDKPSSYNAYLVNFHKSEYDASIDGPSNSSEAPRRALVRGGWRCPMFPAHGDAYKGCVLYDVVFPNVGILGLHLSEHHPDLEVHWRGVQASDYPQLFIYPRSDEPEVECITTYYDPEAMGNPALRIVPKTEPEPDVELSPTPDTMLTDSVPPSSVTPPSAFVPIPIPVPRTPIKREPSPAPSADSDIVELLALPPLSAPRPIIAREYKTGIPLDPYIQPPYLTSPIPTEDGGLIYYSCRPGGPRIYDHLQMLSLKPYGLMRWQVEETESHILESEGLSDVGKCMHALHNRWVFLHEVNMYVDPAKCIADFVHTWWRHIYNMVGLKVLTHYIADFQHLRLLSVKQAGAICRQYRLDVRTGTAEDGSLICQNQEGQQDPA